MNVGTGQGSKPIRVRVTPAARAGNPKPPPAPKPARAVLARPTPDQADRAAPAPRQAHRARVQAVVVKQSVREQARQQANARVQTPDQRDRERPAAQQAHDRAVVAQNVATARRAVLRQQHAGSLGRAIAKGVDRTIHQNATTLVSTGAGPTMIVPGAGRHGGLGFATITPRTATATESTYAGGLALHILPDAADLVTGTPPSVAKLAATAVTHPKKVPGMLAAPYGELYHHPGSFIQQHPVTAALMLDPLRVPGRAIGRVARAAGRQTLERPAAALPGTALKEARTGSRDVAVRAAQSLQDDRELRAAQAVGAPHARAVTVKQVHRRVDEFRDIEHRRAIDAEHRAVNQAEQSTRHLPIDQRHAAIEQAREQARQQARQDTGERFAREFGANQRPSVGFAARDLAHEQRAQAMRRADAARLAAREANAAHDQAAAAARAARARAKRSSALSALETQRRDAARDLARAQRAHATARVGLGVARGRAQVLSRNVGGQAGGYGVAVAARTTSAAGDAVRAVRVRIHDLDQQIAAERRRVSGVPPAEHQALLDAIHAKGTASAELASARAEADAARTIHIAAKHGTRTATLVDAAGEGRTFAHSADAAKVADRLNAQGLALRTGRRSPAHFELREPDANGSPVALARGGGERPLEFVVREVGDGRYAAVPKVAAERMYKSGGEHPPLSHASVGSSKSTGSKVMRTTRRGLTQATLPTSAKWLGGQVGEAGVRALVARSGPLDLLRFHQVVKRLNKQRPGLGDALRMRVTGAHAGLVGEAKDFANGKSLAEEFAGTPLSQPAAAASYVAHAAPLRAARAGFRRYTSVVLNQVNGAIENTTREAMAGQAIRQGALMERHIIGLTDKALQDAERGLRETHAQVQLGRAVDLMYGRYSKFSPEIRTLILHWTPYLPWTLNVMKFLGVVLPRDHPVISALLADANNLELQWRKQHGLSILDPNHVPLFMLGTYPLSGQRYQPIGRYTPFGITDPASNAASLVLPQLIDPLRNLGGEDYTGKQLKHPGYAGKPFSLAERAAKALTSAVESQVPLASQVAQVTGLQARYIDKKSPDSIPPLGERAKKLLPTAAIHSAGSPTGPSTPPGLKVKPITVKPLKIKPIRVKPIKVR